MNEPCPLLAQSRHGLMHRTRPLSGVKTDMQFCGCLLLRSLLGLKQTWPIALHMSAFDPKRTWPTPSTEPV